LTWPDLPADAAQRFGPRAGELTYGLTFEADSPAEAERIAAESGAAGIGRYHLEQLAEEPDEVQPGS
jgi:hypothetical protein